MKKNKVKDVIIKVLNDILNSYFFVIIIGLLIFAKTIMFYNNTVSISDSLDKNTIIGTLGFILSITCFLSILPNRIRVIASYVVNILISILLFADNIYYIFSNSILSVAQISNLQYAEQILSTLPSLLKLKYILYFVDIILISILFISNGIKIEKKNEYTKKQNAIRLIIEGSGILILYLCCNTYIEKGNDKLYNKDLQIRASTIYGYHISDIERSINYKSQAKYKTYAEMETVYNSLKDKYNENYGQNNYNFEAIGANKNIIVVQLESIQDFVINAQINGKEITPNLNKFFNENIRFTNMHMQSYSSTADSEHSAITSLYPMENGMSFTKYYTNTYDDLFKIFNNANYYTSYMHGNYPYFWNRGNLFGRLNVNSLNFMENFEDTSERINEFLSDELLYTQAVEKAKMYDNPFLLNVVSASSHTPFTLEGIQNKEEKINIDVGEYKDTYFGNYLEAVNYADYAFGIFIEKLKDADLYDNTTILVYGDHNGLTMYDEEMLDFLKQTNPNLNDIETKLNYTRVACGLKLSEEKTSVIDKPVSKLDIKPTLSYLAGVEDGISIGTNMFESKDFVCLNNERIITDKYYFDEQWYEIGTGQKINLENISEEEKIKLQQYYDDMKKELDLSISIIINDLLSKK